MGCRPSVAEKSNNSSSGNGNSQKTGCSLKDTITSCKPEKNKNSEPKTGGDRENSENHKDQSTALNRAKFPLHLKAISGPSQLTNSQIDFFRMLDEKVEKGKDYHSSDDVSANITTNS